MEPLTFSVLVNGMLARYSDLASVLLGIGLVYFLWGLADFIRTGSAEAKEEGRQRMINGVIGLFIIVSVWGLVRLLAVSIGLDNNEVGPNDSRVEKLINFSN